jgi:hypothetical protein
MEEKMVKKFVMFCTVTAVFSAALFAQEAESSEKKPSVFSAGLGGSFLVNFSSYSLTSAGKDAMLEKTPTQIGGEVFVFFDARYVEWDLGMSFLKDDKSNLSTTNFEIQLIGKYPIAVGDRLAILPLIGVDFKIALDQDPSIDDESPFEMLSNVWFKWGWGADLALTKRIYLRTELLYGIGTNSKSQKDQIDIANKITKMIDTIINHGLDVRLAVGYKF